MVIGTDHRTRCDGLRPIRTRADGGFRRVCRGRSRSSSAWPAANCRRCVGRGRVLVGGARPRPDARDPAPPDLDCWWRRAGTRARGGWACRALATTGSGRPSSSSTASATTWLGLGSEVYAHPGALPDGEPAGSMRIWPAATSPSTRSPSACWARARGDVLVSRRRAGSDLEARTAARPARRQLHRRPDPAAAAGPVRRPAGLRDRERTRIAGPGGDRRRRAGHGERQPDRGRAAPAGGRALIRSPPSGQAPRAGARRGPAPRASVSTSNRSGACCAWRCCRPTAIAAAVVIAAAGVDVAAR